MAKHKAENHMGRRRFLRGAAAGVIAVPIVGLLGTRKALAEEKLDPSNSQAQALDYTHDASEATGHSAYTEGAVCNNCSQWTGGDEQWGTCNLFPGKLVNADGWCTGWSKA